MVIASAGERFCGPPSAVLTPVESEQVAVASSLSQPVGVAQEARAGGRPQPPAGDRHLSTLHGFNLRD